MSPSRLFSLTRSLATLSLLAAAIVPATLTAAPSTARADMQSDFIMSDGRICNPRWGCNAGTQSDLIMSDGRICNPRWGCNALRNRGGRDR